MKKFVEENVDVVSLFPIVTTRSTGAVLENAFGLAVQHKTCSGPLGGDQEIGGMISLGQVDGV
jgi:methylglyoxal synthase